MATALDFPELTRPAKRGGRMSERSDEVHLRPCATDLGFWAEVPAVRAEGRCPVLASGCGAVSTFLAEPSRVEFRAVSGTPQRHGAGAAGAE